MNLVLKYGVVATAFLLGLGIPAGVSGADKKKKPSLQQTVIKLSWLAGSWQVEKNGQLTEEQWMVPAGGGMLGMNRATAKGRVLEHRFLQLREGPGGSLFYILQGSGLKESVFPMKSLTESVAVFENQGDGFPKTITYTLQSDGSLATVWEGEGADGQPRRIDHVFQRVIR